MKFGGFALRRVGGSEHFRTRCLIETRLPTATPDGFEEAHCAESGDVAGIFGHIEADSHVALRSEVIKLIGRKGVNQIEDPFRAGEIAVMEKKFRTLLVGIFVDVIDALRVEGAGAADDSVNFV